MTATIHAFLLPVAVDLARAAAWFFILGIVFIPLERLFAAAPRLVLRRQSGVDIGYYFANSVVTVALLSGITAIIAVGLHHVVPGVVLATAAELPLWGRMAATLAVSEFGSYWGHRWSHEIPLLWRFHAIHHSATAVDWLTSTRGHPVDVMIPRLCGFVPVFVLGLAQPVTSGQGLVVPLVAVFTLVWGFFIHANVRWRLGWLEAVIATPAFHRWHHTNDAHRDRNYASTLPIYDRLFGTLYLPPTGVPPSFGIDAPMAEGLVGQLLSPLQGPR